jgi:energy-converting hydrogenase Eha subunit G
MIKKIANTISSRPYQIFLIDGFGALLTTGLLYFIVARIDFLFKIPQSTVYLLAGIALCFAIYSLSCYTLRPKNWKPCLKVIMVANLLYCMLTLGLLMSNPVTIWDVLYFMGEVIIVLILVRIEYLIL